MSAILTMQQQGWEAYAGKLGTDLMQKAQDRLTWLCEQVEGDHVLVADCGQAAAVILLARAGKNVIGLCRDPIIYKQACTFVDQEPIQVQRTVQLHEGKLADALSLVDRSFDTVILTEDIAQASNPRELIEIAYRKSQPEGTLITLWPLGVQDNIPARHSFFLREPARYLARHFEIRETRIFGDTIALVSKARKKVLIRTPVASNWPDSIVKDLENALREAQQHTIDKLHAVHEQLAAMQTQYKDATERLSALDSLQAEHESQAATLRVQLEAIQHAKKDTESAAQQHIAELKAELEARQAAVNQATQAAAQLQAQSRISELEQAQQVAVLRHEKLERDLRIKELEQRAAVAQRDTLEVQRVLDETKQKLLAGEVTAQLQHKQFDERLHELEGHATASVLEAQNARDEAMQRLQASNARFESQQHEFQQRIQQLEGLVEETMLEAQSDRDKATQNLLANEATIRAQREKFEVSIQEMQSSLASKLAEIEALRSLSEQSQYEATQRIQTLQQEKAQNERHFRVLQAEAAGLRAEIGNLHRAHDELAAQHHQATLSLKTLNVQLLQARADNEQFHSHATTQTQELQKQLDGAKSELTNVSAQLKDAQMKYRDLLAQYRTTQELEKEAVGKVRHLERRVRNLQHEKEQAVHQVEQARNTLSFQLGYALIHGFKSWRAFSKLPKELARINREAKLRRERRALKHKANNLSTATTARATASDAADIALTIAKKLGDNAPVRLKVAAIMDEFTYHSYAPECDLRQLRPETWQTELEEFKPDLMFVESAWKGIDDSWKGIISNATVEIQNLLRYCRDRGIPSIFWNKEDPVHFSTFIPVAALVDHVFTTDIDCLPKYRAALGHERVSLLPFAAQPQTHNPIEKFERKDAFNFAGSYYLRYPERQRDFNALIDTVSQLKPVEIYDRNHDKPHPHYEFPAKYSKMILGSLPFSEIDRAYKGYRYGVNMNTIKQSQTMFARRVYELLASNTVVVSNFSRGVRLMFGSLVICSDDADQLKKQLEIICEDELIYRKFRLLGLRKVMSQHTYRHRLEYIKSRLAGKPSVQYERPVLLLAEARNDAERNQIITAFKRQSYSHKALYLLAQETPTEVLDEKIQCFSNKGAMAAAVLSSLEAFDLIGALHPQDYYASNYITDLALAAEYTQMGAYTKIARYAIIGAANVPILMQDGMQYKSITTAAPQRSLFLLRRLAPAQIDALVKNTYRELSIEAIATDEFNYCQDGAAFSDSAISVCDDLQVGNTGISLDKELVLLSDSIKNVPTPPEKDDMALPRLSGKDLQQVLRLPPNTDVVFTCQDDVLHVKSTLSANKHTYVYSNKIYNRDELNMVLNSQFQLRATSDFDVKSVFEFQDAKRKKIAHQMNAIGGSHTLAIPSNCAFIRLGLRFQGSGKAAIQALVLGSHGETPSAVISRSPYLVLTKQYPAYDDLYRYGFLHSRVRAYRDEGLRVDVFRVTATPENPYREFEDVDVVNGDVELLDRTLSSGQYKKVLVHLLDEKMWAVLEKHLDNIKIDVWAHGAEIQVWQRREFEFERMSPQEIARQKKLSDKRVKFWRHVLANPAPHPNLHMVVVSQHFANEIFSDMGLDIPRDSYSIIHNFIDGEIFDYTEKTQESRKKLLSIRPYASRKYANDLTVQCILNLSHRPFFNDLQFYLYGDGDLFESVTEPVRHFDNVHLERRFLSQNEISRVHKENGIFLTPTRMDAQGVSRDEAMSSGLVPITNAVAAVPEFVDNTCGYVVAGEDARAMADAIEEMYKNPDIFLQKSRNAAQRVAKQCGFGNTIAKEISLITQNQNLQ